MNFNLKLFLRSLAGLIYAVIYGHDVWTVELLFGLTMTTISFYVTLLSFYLFVYAYKFHGLRQQPNFCECDKHCRMSNYAILGFNFFIALYYFWIHQQAVTTADYIALGFEEFFIMFPEVVLEIIERPFRKE